MCLLTKIIWPQNSFAKLIESVGASIPVVLSFCLMNLRPKIRNNAANGEWYEIQEPTQLKWVHLMPFIIQLLFAHQLWYSF